MDVAGLIRELQALPPGARVHVINRSVEQIRDRDGVWKQGPFEIPDTGSREVDEVRHMGPFVLVSSR